MKRFILVALLLSLLLLSGCTDYQSKYYELQDLYDEMQAEYESINEDIRNQLGNLEDDMAVVYLYFDQDDDFSFEDARESYNRIDSVLSNIINP